MKQLKRKTALLAAMLLLLTQILTAAAYADAEQETGRAVASVYDMLKSIVLPLATVGIAGSGIQFLTGDETSAAKAKKRMIVILCAAAAIWFLPSAAVWGKNLLGGAVWSPENPAG